MRRSLKGSFMHELSKHMKSTRHIINMTTAFSTALFVGFFLSCLNSRLELGFSFQRSLKKNPNVSGLSRFGFLAQP